MTKKILAMLLASAMVLSFAGCNNESGNGGGGNEGGNGGNEGGNGGNEGGNEGGNGGGDETTTTPENTIDGNVDAEDAIVIWTWNTDIKTILDKVLKDVNPDLYNRIVYVNTGGSDYYQDKLDNILQDPSNKLYPDIVALEADYILKYTGGQNLANIADLGITAADYSKEYKYTIDIGTSPSGDVKALSWQAAPGGWVIRTDLAEKYLGTSDPKEVQAFFKDWDAVYETAKKVKADSGDETRLIPGYDDLMRVYQGARKNGWYGSDDTLVIDPAMLEYMDYAKKLNDEELTWGTTQWSDPWVAHKNDDSTLALPGCTWYTYWSTDTNHFGSYILVEGPQAYAWGGTWLAATAGYNTALKDDVAQIIKYFTCDTDFMIKINDCNADYVNNTDAIQDRIDNNIVAALDGKNILSDKQGETFIAFFKRSGIENINGNLLTPSDATLNSLFSTQVDAYVKGGKSKDDAVQAFKDAAADTYSWLKV
ncbi:MAG: hypothetical protein J1F60_06810 [Oscillospiraceae bacterium]|nr:hypothetical protein [Oscillospiraceae bacterium]